MPISHTKFKKGDIMSNIIDLNILFPEEKKLSIKTKDGKVYKFKVSIPNRLALDFIKIYNEKDESKGEFELALELTHKLLIYTYPEITIEYIEENFLWKHIMYISNSVKNEVFDSIDIVQGKKPGEDSDSVEGAKEKK